MNGTLNGAALVAQWRNGGNSPAGPLFAAGQFAEGDIVHAAFDWTYSSCSGSSPISCC